MDGFVDPYADPATGILRNRVGARTRAELDRGAPGQCPAPSFPARRPCMAAEESFMPLMTARVPWRSYL